MRIYSYLQRARAHNWKCSRPSAKASTNNVIVLSEITSTAQGDIISALSESVSINIIYTLTFFESFKVFSWYKATVDATNTSADFRNQFARNELGHSETGTLTQL